MTKNEIRRHNKALRNTLANDLMDEYNRKIRERLFDLDLFKECTMLFTYVSFGKEADTHEIINQALIMNKNVYVPKVEQKEINFYDIHDLESLVRSDYGILEPEGNINYRYTGLQSKNNKLMLLPGLAFDIAGNRIGYGEGYYDKYLGKYPSNEWVKLALAYDFQLTDRFDVGVDDIPADYILTPEKFIVCKI